MPKPALLADLFAMLDGAHRLRPPCLAAGGWADAADLARILVRYPATLYGF